MSLNTKIEKSHDGKYFYRCLLWGCLMSSRYGIPREKGGTKGSFKDPLCAVKWVVDMKKQGRLSEEKAKRYLESIHEDLDLTRLGKELVEISIDDIEVPDYSYQKKFPWMMHPRSGYTHVSVDSLQLQKNQEKREKKSASKQFRLYTLDPQEPEEGENSISSFLLTGDKKLPLEMETPLVVRKIVRTEYKSKPCWLLSEENTEDENRKISAMFKKNMKDLDLKGRVHLLIDKALNDDGNDEGEVSIVSRQSKPKKESKESLKEKVSTQITSLLISKDDLKKSDEKSEQQKDSSPSKKRSRKE